VAKDYVKIIINSGDPAAIMDSIVQLPCVHAEIDRIPEPKIFYIKKIEAKCLQKINYILHFNLHISESTS